MTRKTYAVPATIEHGGATAITLGAGAVSSEGGSQLFE